MSFGAKSDHLQPKYRRAKTADLEILAWLFTSLLSVILPVLKPKSRAKKSASQVKIGQIVHRTVLFLKRSRHLGYPDYVVCYRGSKSAWDAKMRFQASVL